MNRTKRITIKQLLNKLHKGKRLLCFGAGGRFNELIEAYSKDNLEQYIDYIFDNDEKKWNTYKEINGIKIPIKSPLNIKEIYDKNYIILITLRCSDQVIDQIITSVGKKIVCYETPVLGTWISGPVNLYMKVIRFLFKRLPLKNMILFGGWGDSQRENEMALRDCLVAKGYDKKYKIIWFSDKEVDETIDKQSGYEILHRTKLATYHNVRDIFKYYNVLYRSKYLFFENHAKPKVRKKQKNVYLNHGVPPIKQTKYTIILPKSTDICVCTSPEIADIVCEQYTVDTEKLLYCGNPRFDHLFLEEKYIERFLQGKKYDKIILWVPTFRQHNILLSRWDSNRLYECGIPLIEKIEDFEVINRKLQELNVCLMIKPHPLQDLSFVKVNQLTNIVLLLQEDLNREKIGVNCVIKDVDAMITDYSTISFDFMLLDRPIAYAVDDMEDYNVGFSTESPLDWMPGRHMKNKEEMLLFIEDVCKGIDEKRQERNVVRDKVHINKKGGNSEELIRKLGL